MKSYKITQHNTSTIYVGIDVHKNHYTLTVRTYDIELFTGSIQPENSAVIQHLKKYKATKIKVVYEAGYAGFCLYDALIESGIDCIVTPPSLIPSEAGNRVKTDRLDSRKLAHLLSRDLLKKVWVPDKELRYHREFLRRRKQLVKDRKRTQTRIISFLDLYNISFIPESSRWSVAFRNELGKIEFKDKYLKQNFNLLLKEYDQLDNLLMECTNYIRELSKLARYKEDIELLREIKGIGLLTSMEFLLEIGDVTRFQNSKQIAAYVGLTPSQYSSGEYIKMGHIVKCGKSNLRSLLVEASWTLIRNNEILRKKYNEIKYRAGGKRAIVAIARKLLIIMRIMLLNKVHFNYN